MQWIHLPSVKGSGEVEAEISEESKKNKGLPHGYEPNQKEIEQHERTHIPFRSWCKLCVRGKSKASQHHKADMEGVCGISTVSIDYIYVYAQKTEW